VVNIENHFLVVPIFLLNDARLRYFSILICLKSAMRLTSMALGARARRAGRGSMGVVSPHEPELVCLFGLSANCTMDGGACGVQFD
jgi:hypothetical protein